MKNPFRRKPSTDNAVRALTNAIDELEAVIEMENTEIDRLDDEIKERSTSRLNAFDRRDRAQIIADRFRGFITV